MQCKCSDSLPDANQFEFSRSEARAVQAATNVAHIFVLAIMETKHVAFPN
jgi:hypothetical protein